MMSTRVPDTVALGLGLTVGVVMAVLMASNGIAHAFWIALAVAAVLGFAARLVFVLVEWRRSGDVDGGDPE